MEKEEAEAMIASNRIEQYRIEMCYGLETNCGKQLLYIEIFSRELTMSTGYLTRRLFECAWQFYVVKKIIKNKFELN